jgi:O-antigen/teichoic acid export membrane protein
MLGFLKTASDVGIYNAAHPTAALMFILPTAFISLFLPIITELYSKNKMNEVKEVYKRVSKWIFFVNLPIFLFMATFSRQIINIAFGQDYVSGAAALTILAFGYLIYSFSYTSSNILSMAKKTRIILFVTIFFAGLNVLFNYLLIPVYGINGAAIATSSSFIFASLLYFIFNFNIIRNLPFQKQYFKAMLSGIFSLAIIYGILQLISEEISFFGFVSLLLLFIFFYAGFLFLFKSFEKEDKEIISLILRRFKHGII